MKITEDNYVELIRQHQERALVYFIEQHGWIVKSIVFKQLHQFWEDCEECMNDVFLAVWEHIDSYDEIKGSFLNWVAAISKYKAISYLRAHTKDVVYESIDQVELASPQELIETILHKEAAQEFMNLIRCLKKEDQQLFIKYFVEGKNSDEISTELGLKREIVYNRLSRGKKKLKNVMEGRC